MQPAVVAVLLLLLPLSSCLAIATAGTNGSSGNTSCTPARCGDMNITYPFFLGGVQPLYCGYPAFELTCDANRTYLSLTLRQRMYRVHNIFYENSSLVMAVERTFAGDVTCPIPDFNVSAGLALLPLNISDTNKDLVFLHNCPPGQGRTLTPPCANNTYISERPHEEGKPPQGIPVNCSYVTVPVREFQGRDPVRDYGRLISDGFQVEWLAKPECGECRGRGGECRFVEFSFRCICRDGRPCPNSRGKQHLLTRIGNLLLNSDNQYGNTLSSSRNQNLGRRRKRKRSASLVGLIRDRDGTPLASLRKEFSMTSSPRTHIFTYEELDEATDGFSNERELGVGGFGTVYKGTCLSVPASSV
ncbi:hypothetical protein BAE44_0007286 [Dichanthelium oligosanthes]|uniref:Wall-associated receptor kinase galacturonan-binding domain-containing protein n=1 Tax=Dichanthelium oligosanthes TaxID=888268 RepID=A0A1E5W2T4_9POAL|nr:hypothetical protein BAE44_0007286 [Dichanthelium oligosanthes]